jgi:putative transposase
VVAARQRRRQVAYGIKRGLSQRRACSLFSVARSTLSYASTLDRKDAPVLVAMRRLARLYPRFGYRRIAILLRREGHAMSFDRAWRLWKKGELQVPKKRKRRRPATSRPRPLPPENRNAVWAYDFVFDRCANGQTLKCLTVVDEYTRKCLAIDVAARIRSARVIDQLAQLISVHGAPRYIRSDNGGEFVSRAILKWLTENRITTAFIDPGKPWQNGLDESFNGKFRDECLNMEWFRSRTEARVIIEAWRKHYNNERPHSSLDYQTPNEFIESLPEGAQPSAVL